MPEITWERTAPPPDEQLIESVQQDLGVQLPGDFLASVRESDGGRPSSHVLDFGRRLEAVFIRRLSFYDEGVHSREPGIVETYDAIKDRLPPDVVPFGRDPFGNIYCFDYRNQTEKGPKVVFWDHEGADPESPDASLTHVCDSFTDLLGMLYDI